MKGKVFEIKKFPPEAPLSSQLSLECCKSHLAATYFGDSCSSLSLTLMPFLKLISKVSTNKTQGKEMNIYLVFPNIIGIIYICIPINNKKKLIRIFFLDIRTTHF